MYALFRFALPLVVALLLLPFGVAQAQFMSGRSAGPVVIEHGSDPILGDLCSIPPLPVAPCTIVRRHARVVQVASTILLQQVGMGPWGPMCAGPKGPGPCEQVRMYLAMLRVARLEFPLQQIGMHPIFGPMCSGPLGPGPCDAVHIFLMQTDGGGPPPNLDPRRPQLVGGQRPMGVPMCSGPFGAMPCTAVAQVGLDRMGTQFLSRASFGVQGGLGPQQLAFACAQRVGIDVAAFAACTGQQVILPENQQRVLDCAVQNREIEGFAKCAAPKLGIDLSEEQRILTGCSAKADGDAQAFAQCAGSKFAQANLKPKEQAVLRCGISTNDIEAFADCAAPYLLKREQEAVLRCAVTANDTRSFATCAAAHSGVKMSEDQRIAIKCATQANGQRNAFLACAGAALVGRNIGPKEQAVLNCATNHNSSTEEFASCAATSLLGNRMSEEQRIAVKCAAQSQGDAGGFATCAGANMVGLQLNPEQQIAVQCVVQTGGQPYAAAGCMASRLTARELTKCLTDGFGGKGCFGDNNDLVGKNGWLRRTMANVAGGPNSVINNPDQIWGGDNSFVRNPHQIMGGRNSFVRNPSTIWGGQNSIFNNPSQLLPKPKTIGKVGGKRICLPWC